MNFIRKSLGIKIILPVSVITVITFAILGFTNSQQHRSATAELINHSATQMASILLSAIEEPMAIGDNEGTVGQLRKVAKNYPDVTVYLTNYKGNITYSTDEGTLRRDMAEVRNIPEFLPCLEKSLKQDMSKGVQLKHGDQSFFVAVDTIPNHKECYHCHGSSQEILGTMVLFQDISPQMAKVAASERTTAIISFAGAIFLLLLLGLFIKKIVISKIVTIAAISDRIREGDYSAQFEVVGHDELANLADNLKVMVQTVQDQLEYNKGVLQGIIIPLFVTDNDSRFNYINAPLRNILGLSEDEIVGHTLASIFTDSEHGDVANQVIASGQSKNGQMEYTRSDGVAFPLHYEISPLKDAADNIVGAIGMMIDLTQEERDKERIRAQRENLLQVANEVAGVANNLNDSAGELSRQMNEVTNGMAETAGQTSQVATAMEEMNATVMEVAQNAGKASDASDAASSVAKGGGKEVERTVEETREMARTTEALAETLNDLSTKAENIGAVMAVINDIADQTNLLALNAAIEAARAGEAGRGFAVVADEVRKLAEKTMGATQEVDSAITAIQSSAKEAVEEMTNTRERVGHTEQMAEAAGQVLKEIVEQSDSIADMVRSIATASEQQSATSEEININVTGINELSQSISTRINEANTSIQEVAAMSEKLSTLVEKFKE
ncbi:methyl-accepting chemotaxis protein [Desulfovibrio ferrophilus]|uniref:Methyl-accepting chemotaxis sensory transducer with Pas/Pac sensor n=1 Tax=Desulfovibrio ferrophilus TaxID=241368 RepID=A0A2Z6B2E4_9BACT|nr:methyl-accepting chemotaxis protein [Desulfovibrio ferrophilus]BBD09651.1 methyl-accepting chemotaxis sensory transducer with Pas/Pac sensor [Desulfovibrio ferrophilus]